MTQTHGPGAHPRPPRVVLFRANAIDSDSRAKKFSLTLARLGYDVHVLSAEEAGASTAKRYLGSGDARVTVHPVIVTQARRDVHKLILGARRRRRFLVVDWTPTDEYVTQIAELKQRARDARQAADAVRSPDPEAPARPPLWHPRWAALRLRFTGARARLVARRARWRGQWVLNVGYRQLWREWDKRKQATTLLATTRGTLPEVEDYATSFGRALDELEPDIIHAHHPLVLGTALRAARRRRARGHPVRVVYDAREDFTGLPHQERGHIRRHAVLVREEARNIRAVDAVVTVSEPIADTLQRRYGLADRPAVVLNMPVFGQGRATGPTVREAAGLGDGVRLVVYSGALSRARGIDTLVDALVHLGDPRDPAGGVHCVVVPVPSPHPLAVELLAQARREGVADRLHFVPSVDQDRLLHYLSGADVGVMPLRTGSANIEQALPNKLFENLHAGLTMVTSDAALMKAFVTENDLGEVYADPDAKDLARAIEQALARDRVKASVHAVELSRRWSWQAQETVIRDLYARLGPAPRPEGIADQAFPALAVPPAGHPAALSAQEPLPVVPAPADLAGVPPAAPAEGR